MEISEPLALAQASNIYCNTFSIKDRCCMFTSFLQLPNAFKLDSHLDDKEALQSKNRIFDVACRVAETETRAETCMSPGLSAKVKPRVAARTQLWLSSRFKKIKLPRLQPQHNQLGQLTRSLKPTKYYQLMEKYLQYNVTIPYNTPNYGKNRSCRLAGHVLCRKQYSRSCWLPKGRFWTKREKRARERETERQVERERERLHSSHGRKYLLFSYILIHTIYTERKTEALEILHI